MYSFSLVSEAVEQFCLEGCHVLEVVCSFCSDLGIADVEVGLSQVFQGLRREGGGEAGQV